MHLADERFRFKYKVCLIWTEYWTRSSWLKSIITNCVKNLLTWTFFKLFLRTQQLQWVEDFPEDFNCQWRMEKWVGQIWQIRISCNFFKWPLTLQNEIFISLKQRVEQRWDLSFAVQNMISTIFCIPIFSFEKYW